MRQPQDCCTISYYGGIMRAIVTEEIDITEEEKAFIEQYRAANEEIKTAIKAILQVGEE